MLQAVGTIGTIVVLFIMALTPTLLHIWPQLNLLDMFSRRQHCDLAGRSPKVLEYMPVTSRSTPDADEQPPDAYKHPPDAVDKQDDANDNRRQWLNTGGDRRQRAQM